MQTTARVLLVLIALFCVTPRWELSAQGTIEAYVPLERGVEPGDLDRCRPLHKVMTETLEMAAEISGDTIEDWRTRRILPGCRVTAVGSMLTQAPGEENNVFYAALRIAGWTRTPDPYDRPFEAAVMLRFQETDCFFTPYSGIVLGTEAEFRVNDQLTTGPGEKRYSFLARCVEALPAARR